MPVVGFIRSAPAATSMHLVAAFCKGLAEAGFVEGKDVAIELRFADDDFDRLHTLATDLVRRGVAVIVGNYFALPAIRAATMAPANQTPIARRVSTRRAFSRARSPPTCRSCNRRSSSL